MSEQDTADIIVTIVGVQANLIVAKTDTGDEVLCRSVKRLHRTLGFLTVPHGRRARIRYSKGTDKTPLILEVLND